MSLITCLLNELKLYIKKTIILQQDCLNKQLQLIQTVSKEQPCI